MANRKELVTIRDARAGQATAQLSLGRQYLFGTKQCAGNLPSALYWLERAATQGVAEAWLLIGRHIPYEVARRITRPLELSLWYEKAFAAGVTEAGLVMARLVLEQPAANAGLRIRALKILQQVAEAGVADAQWLLARQFSRHDGSALTPARRQEDVNGIPGAIGLEDNETLLEWVRRAAQNGVMQAQYALAEHAWKAADQPGFMRWALPLARQIALRLESLRETLNPGQSPHRQYRRADISILSRCARALFEAGNFAAGEIGRFWECAAYAGDRIAQYSLGLWFAKMDGKGRRVAAIPGAANYKKSVRWLLLAAEQGMADAWYALSRIYLKPECSQRNPSEAQRYLEQAAHAGHGVAQLELARRAWRSRRERDGTGIEAVCWLQKAAAQGIPEAESLLGKLTVPVSPAAWAEEALRRLCREARDKYPRLVARIELAAIFGLTRTESLLIDPRTVDHGHCLMIDVRVLHPHGRVRFIRLRTAEQRRALDRILCCFDQADPVQEGNYRQRLYRLKSLIGKQRDKQDAILATEQSVKCR